MGSPPNIGCLMLSLPNYRMPWPTSPAVFRPSFLSVQGCLWGGDEKRGGRLWDWLHSFHTVFGFCSTSLKPHYKQGFLWSFALPLIFLINTWWKFMKKAQEKAQIYFGSAATRSSRVLQEATLYLFYIKTNSLGQNTGFSSTVESTCLAYMRYWVPITVYTCVFACVEFTSTL